MASYESWRVYIGFNSSPNDRTAPLTDVTSYVDTKRQPIVIDRGRSSERSTIQNATCSFALQNSDQRFTPGNPSSPYAPWVLSGRRVVVTDTVDGEEFSLVDGFIEFPDAQDWQKSSEDEPRDQVITVNAVDRVARLEQTPAFASTVGASVQSRSPALELYYPLTETDGLTVGEYARGRPPMHAASEGPFFITDPAGVDEMVQLGQGAAALRDDLGHALFQPVIESSSGFVSQTGYLFADLIGQPITITSEQELIVAAWAKLDQGDSSADRLVVSIGGNNPAADYVKILVNSSGQWELRFILSAGPWGNTITASVPAEFGKPTFVAAKVQVGAAALELWVDDVIYAGSSGGVSPSAASFFKELTVGRMSTGSIGHVQIYKSTTANPYTHDDFLDQLEAGMAGYERQRADERITALASLIGLSTDELELDSASALMPTARLAGQKPGPLMREAADTDNGLLFTKGSGRIAFHNRARRYRPLLAATVELTWLEPPLSWRTDPPTNTMDVTAADGTQGRAANADSVAEFGERAGSASVDTACDADPGNLAAFTVREFARPRHRATSLAFELRTRTTEQRKLILRREISDRCALSGLPATAPEGTNTFHVEGIRHRISVQGHRVEWNTGAVYGDVPGVVQPYPKVGQAKVRTETRIPF